MATVQIHDSIHDELRMFCAEENRNMKDVVNMLVKEFLEEMDPEIQKKEGGKN